jgi:hypothetical protein
MNAHKNVIVLARWKSDAIFDRIIPLPFVTRLNSYCLGGRARRANLACIMEDNAPVEVNVLLTPDELRDVFRSSPVKYLTWLLIAFGIYLAYFVFAEIVNEGFSAETAFTIIWNGIVALGALLVGFFFTRFRAHQLVRHGPTLREPRRYSFSANGVHFDGELMTCECRWGSFVRIVESSRSFLLYLSPMFGIVIPKAQLSTSDDVSRLRQIFRSHFKGKLKLKS